MIARLARVIFAAAVAVAPPALAGPAVTPLVSTAWLADNLDADGLTVIDIRSGAAFQAGHIPGSIQTDYPGSWRTDRGGNTWALPTAAQLEPFLGSIGVGNDTTVVVVPPGSNSSDIGGATWVYFVLKYLGHDSVALLDGGFTGWQGEGRSLATGPATAPAAATFTADLRPELLAETDYVAARLGTDTVLVDARVFTQYLGITSSSLVTRPGHIPGAFSLDNALFYDAAANRFKPIAGLEAVLLPQLADRSVDVITYCNTGHWGSIDWFVLRELLGYPNVKLYAGSMAEWSRTELPVALGANPN